MFFTIRQNNSGGNFDVDEEKGIAHTVIIEARDRLEAKVFAEDIGLYWDGVENGRDCGCCGDRWYFSEYLEGTEEPELYGKPVEFGPLPSQKPERMSSWTGGFVHYRDGRIVSFTGTKETK